MVKLKFPKVLFWDLEVAGVDSLSADRSFVVCFGYKWGNEKAKCISVLDYPGKNCQDDRNLLRAAREILDEADILVAHYGDKFDRKFVRARLRKHRLSPIPNTRLIDTCLLARGAYRLSSNRLGNLASFLGVKTGKMEKRGGWPDWWMGALRGDKPSVRKMSVYCAQDVQCLSEVYEVMKPDIPNKYGFNMAIGKPVKCCASCGGTMNSRGYYFSEKKMFRRLQCRECGKWDHDTKPIVKAV